MANLKGAMGLAFNNPVDIANRALQHVGETRIDPTLGFNEDSKRASETAFVYDKLRRAEMERNVWRFSVRRTVIRPIDSNTMMLAPAIWMSLTTYFVGSIVQDSSGALWISVLPENLNNAPGNSTAWALYFGPLSAGRYDSTDSYYAGETVYTAAGDGTSDVYLSLASGNAVHPALPNQWSAGTVYQKGNVVQEFPAWAVGTTYAQGETVSYASAVYASLTAGNVGNTPSTDTTNWAPVPVLTLSAAANPTQSPVLEWDYETSYAKGAVVMFNASEYLSLSAANTGNFPNAAGSTDWVVLTGGTLYMSKIDLNIGNDPANAPTLWSSATTYAAGAQVGGSNGTIYTSIGSGNIGHDPTTDVASVYWTNTGVLLPWTMVFTQGGGNSLWMQIGGASFPAGVTLTTPNIVSPIGSGPYAGSAQRSVYRLPAGFLRLAPQDPREGSTSDLGAPTGAAYTDWNMDGNYIVTRTTGAISLRFAADVADVTLMPSQFCEGLACRIALEICETQTQSAEKISKLAGVYEKFMGEARIVNAIEEGAEEAPMDDWLAVRY